MAAVTLSDVAIRAGVSQPTASRVLNGSARKPSERVAEAVRKAAAELGYVPNAQAQALARSSSGLLGLVVHDISDPYFSAIASGVQRAASAQGRQMMLAAAGSSPMDELAAVEAFISHRTDAIVMVGSRRATPEGIEAAQRMETGLARYLRNGGHVAVIGQAITHANAVIPDNSAGAAALARSLIAQGLNEFVVLSGPPDLVTAADRTKGFLAALAEENITPAQPVPGPFTRDGGYDAAVQAFAEHRPKRPHSCCVFAANDVMAVGAMTAFRDLNLEVPRDVAVAGFDDIPTLRDYSPTLTTVRLPLQDMGELAVKLALSEQPDGQLAKMIQGEVILRESTRTNIHG